MKEIASGEIFRSFYQENFIYVDKTKQIFSVLDNHDRVLLSRPRRFGKSTILDTIGTLFESGVEPYFKDTWIYDKWNSPTYPVLRLNFLKFRTNDIQMFLDDFCKQISFFAKQQKLDNYESEKTPSGALLSLFRSLGDREIVILIDEYDR